VNELKAVINFKPFSKRTGLVDRLEKQPSIMRISFEFAFDWKKV
jgi:hypothetical protein